jgi:hypothetical protein
MASISVLIIAVSLLMKHRMHVPHVNEFYVILGYVTISLPFVRHRYLPVFFFLEMLAVAVTWFLVLQYIDNGALTLRIDGRGTMVCVMTPATMVIRLPLAVHLRFGCTPPGIRSSTLISLVTIILLGVIGYAL